MQDKVTFYNYTEVLNFIESPNIGIDTALQIIEAYAAKPFYITIIRNIIDRDEYGGIIETPLPHKIDKQKLIDWFTEYGEIIDNCPDCELPLFMDGY